MVGPEGYEWPDGYEQYEAKRWWYDPPWELHQWPLVRPVYVAGDEFGRKTWVLHLPLLGRLVVAVSKPGFYPDPTINAGALRERKL